MDNKRDIHRPARTEYVLDGEPGTLCRANFRLSLWDEQCAEELNI